MTKSDLTNSYQHGGDHYKRTPLQHWDVVYTMGWDYYIGNATKYIWRLGLKGDPIDDIDKAIHYLKKKRELLIKEQNKASEVEPGKGYVDQD